MRKRASLALIILAMAACTPGESAPNKQETPRLAEDQTLSFPISQDISDFDPALISNPADVDILRNVFSSLYKMDAQLHVVLDVAIDMPFISSDGLTYTFHLRHNAQFSNGDPITAADFIYSWNRAAAKQGDFASLFSLIAGYQDVVAGKATQMSGLVKYDDYTFSATLTKHAGYFLNDLTLWPYWLVDQKVISTAGDDAWWMAPDTLIGSGPFRLSARVPGQSLDFTPVSGWYGGFGNLTHVHVEVVADAAMQVTQYEAGVFSLIGYGRQIVSPAASTRYLADPKLKSQLSLRPLGVTYWVGFNLKNGPFAGIDAGQAGRHAFSEAIDRNALVAAVCNAKSTCVTATGGLISKGLQGYLGDGADTNVKFDATAAKTEYAAWDPTGAKVKGLTYTYDTDPFNKAVCANLQTQWKKNLGADIPCVEMDRKTFFDQRNGACAYPLFRQSWAADYDHPQNWFDYLFVSGAPSSGSCYSNPSLDQLVARADEQPLSQSVSGYRTAGVLLVNETAFAPLVYGVQQYLVHPYVDGAGGNALYDNPWVGMRILGH